MDNKYIQAGDFSALENSQILCCVCERLLGVKETIISNYTDHVRHLKFGERCHIHCYAELCEDKAVDRVLKILELRVEKS